MDFITGTDGKDYTIGLGKAATYVASRNESGQVERRFLDCGEAAPVGAVVHYYLPEYLSDDEPVGERASGAAVSERFAASASLVFRDDRGDEIRKFRPKPAGHDKLSDEEKALDPGPWMPLRTGFNRFVWDLRHPAAMRLRGNKTGEEAFRGPLVLPGTYRVHLRLIEERPTDFASLDDERLFDEEEKELTAFDSFEVVNDPRSPASLDELHEQIECLLAIRDKLSELYDGVKRIRETSEELGRWCGHASRQTAIRTRRRPAARSAMHWPRWRRSSYFPVTRPTPSGCTTGYV